MNKMILIVLGVSFVASSAVATPALVRMHGNMDVNQDGVVSESEYMNQWEKHFHDRDKNKDHQLTVDECGAAVMSADKNKDGVVTFAEDQAMRQLHFKRQDQDGDRSLTLSEVLGTAAKPSAKSVAPVVSAAEANPYLVKLHQTMDANQDGLVSNDEFTAHWKRSFDRRDRDQNRRLTEVETGAELMKQTDKNQDGFVTWDEEQQLRQGHFDHLDKDQNRSLTLAEMLGSASGSSRPAAKQSASEGVDFAALRARVAALSNLTAAPAMHQAEGFDSTDDLVAIFYEGLDWKGQPTKVFAWIGMPDEYTEDVPGVVLVHGGGGTAYKNWVLEWTRRGYAAISIAVEGQTDRKAGEAWESHAWAGPKRSGIYHDSNESLEDQWMYHAVADTILANSLIRSIDGVDASRVGIMGISWGGVITSTVIGIDDRFAFAIPTYGCGGLATAENQYGKSLGNNDTYKQVWDPLLRIQRVQMPTLWFSWPGDVHFPMDRLAANYGSMTVPYSVALVPGLRHGHGPPQLRLESYAFADSVVNGAGPWCVQVDASLQSNHAQVSFESSKTLDRAILVSTTDRGVSGERSWVESPAQLVKDGSAWTTSATLPVGTTAWFINVENGELIASSDYQEIK